MLVLTVQSAFIKLAQQLSHSNRETPPQLDHQAITKRIMSTHTQYTPCDNVTDFFTINFSFVVFIIAVEMVATHKKSHHVKISSSLYACTLRLTRGPLLLRVMCKAS